MRSKLIRSSSGLSVVRSLEPDRERVRELAREDARLRVGDARSSSVGPGDFPRRKTVREVADLAR